MVSYSTKILRKGGTAYFDKYHYGCIGASYYLGCDPGAAQASAFATSTGYPGVIEGEHIWNSPDTVIVYYSAVDVLDAPAQFLVVKRLEDLNVNEEPLVLAFIEEPDVIDGIAGLLAYCLGRYDAVISPVGSGCSSLITFPMKEAASVSPRAVLGMFDVTARPDVDAEGLSFALPAQLFPSLIKNMNTSFLRGNSWEKIRARILIRR